MGTPQYFLLYFIGSAQKSWLKLKWEKCLLWLWNSLFLCQIGLQLNFQIWMYYKRVSYAGLGTYLDWGFLLCWSIFATLFRLRNHFSFCLHKKRRYILSWFVDFGSLRRPAPNTMGWNISESKLLFLISWFSRQISLILIVQMLHKYLVKMQMNSANKITPSEKNSIPEYHGGLQTRKLGQAPIIVVFNS